LQGVGLQGAKVPNSDWLQALANDEYPPLGMEELLSRYEVDPEPKEDAFGSTYYFIREKSPEA
ncbi:MAG TPA: hypothetical protein DCR93_06550, partial [Cytophagales bacterium]|nr:hypothetical protein [Cytophagales bacterium]